jgi:tetratricopeptide (TPR) repeat protein
LGIALAQTGRLPEAMKHWEETLRLKSDDIEAHYNLGIALQKQGCISEAIEQFEQALKLRPDFTDARDALARLRASQ